MFSRSLAHPPRPASVRLLHVTAFLNFAVLGLHVGVYAVQLAPLAAALRLNPGMLGAAGTASALAGILTLLAGGALADRLGRRPVLLIGFCGTAIAFVLLSTVREAGWLYPAMLGYGLCVSFIDLGANTVGSDFESHTSRRAMTGLHAGFSAGACVGALAAAATLAAGVDFRIVYLALAAVLLLQGIWVALSPLPHRTDAVPAHPAQAAELAPSAVRASAPALWRVPAVLLAIAVISVTFFGDGALENFLAVYLRRNLDATILLSGLGVACYHAASLAGRLGSAGLIRRADRAKPDAGTAGGAESAIERRLITAAGLMACLGILIAVVTDLPWVAIAGLLLVGFAVSPIVPVTLGMAGRSAPGRSAQAVALTTAVGYSAFIVGPILVGGVATATGLRLALGLLVISTLGIAVLARRWGR